MNSQQSAASVQFLLFSVILLVAALCSTVYAIQCYSCESVYEPNCAADFELENYFKLDCVFAHPPRFLDNVLTDRNATACVKRVFKEHGVQKYVRSCFFGDVNKTDVGCRMDPTLTAVQNATCYVCDNEDFCNGTRQQPQLEKWKIAAICCFVYATSKFYKFS